MISSIPLNPSFSKLSNFVQVSLTLKMPPKKQVKKQPEEPPKQQVPEIPLHQLQGNGRFSYPSGAEYVGDWKLFNGIKLKHGKGVLTIQKANMSQCGKEIYEGQWVEDQMSGSGTYFYCDGAVYKGQWQNNQHSGFGVYEFPNGTIYEGQWLNHLMHGTGFFIDHTGRKWGGEFRKGNFQSKHQAELVKEKGITLKKIEVKKQIDATFTALLEAVSKSDKKTLKQNLSPFFATVDNLKEYIKDPYAKLDERPLDKWTEVITIAKSGAFKIVQSADQAILITPDRILGRQLQGAGQVVQITGSKEDRTVKVGMVCAQNNKWIVVCVIDDEKKK